MTSPSTAAAAAAHGAAYCFPGPTVIVFAAAWPRTPVRAAQTNELRVSFRMTESITWAIEAPKRAESTAFFAHFSQAPREESSFALVADELERARITRLGFRELSELSQEVGSSR